MTDMTDYFNFLDQELSQQTMPSDYKHLISHIFCNDCEKRSETNYHFFYHKCCHCKSYNTAVLKTVEEQQQPINFVSLSPPSS